MAIIHEVWKRYQDETVPGTWAAYSGTGRQKNWPDRYGHTFSFGYQMRFNLQDGFPLVTTKKIHLRSIFTNCLFLKGDTNINTSKDNGVSIWDECGRSTMEISACLWFSWRSWPGRNGEGIDQITKVIDQIRKKPDSRRHVVSAWNPDEWMRWLCPLVMPCSVLCGWREAIVFNCTSDRVTRS